LRLGFQVKEYLTQEGKNPYRDWLETLDNPVKQRIQARILRFESGNLGDVKALGEGIFEARIDYGPGYRIYFGQEGNVLVLLLFGGDKSSQKKDILRAKNFWKQYKEKKDAQTKHQLE